MVIPISEFFYPIGIVPDGSYQKMLCMYQDSARRMHVLLCDTTSKTCEPCLSMQYNPTNVLLLPDGSGFSFVDHGILKIKHFNKRSAKIVEIYEPLRNITCFQWTSDGKYCILQAQRTEHIGIYAVSHDGEVVKILTSFEVDYKFPQIVGDTMFCVRTTRNGSSQLVSKNLMTQDNQILFTIEKSIVHITMLDSSHGCLVSCEDSDGPEIYFFWYELCLWRIERVRGSEEAICFDNNHDLCEVSRPFFPEFSKNRLYLPSRESSFNVLLSYFDIDDHCLHAEQYSRFFCMDLLTQCPFERCRNSILHFFGTPLFIDKNCFIGMAW